MHKLARAACLLLWFSLVGCRYSSTDISLPVAAGKTAVAAPSLPSPTSTSLPPATSVTVGLHLIADGLISPLALAAPDDGSGRLLVADQAGVVWLLLPTTDGFERQEVPFLDLRPRLVSLNEGYEERGLLGLALHPEFEENGRLFVYYSAPATTGSEADHVSHLSEFVVLPLANRVVPASERIILQLEQPTPAHNGGSLTFGPDGMLYLGLGDGGPGHDPEQRAQDLRQLHGSILRIDVDPKGELPYNIPNDNPFVAAAGLPEIFAYGFRNAYRISFDTAGSQALIVADVGHDTWEEVNVVVSGGNYGWSIREGNDCFTPPTEKTPRTGCVVAGADGLPLLPPVLAYDHEVGAAIVGGYVYRGTALSELDGRYVFGDWGWDQGQLFVTGHPIEQYGAVPGAVWQRQALNLAAGGEALERQHILGFGQDAENELYVLTSARLGPYDTTGQIFKIVPPDFD